MHKRPSSINNSRNGGGLKLRKGEKFTTLKSNFGGPINRVGRESFVLFLPSVPDAIWNSLDGKENIGYREMAITDRL